MNPRLTDHSFASRSPVDRWRHYRTAFRPLPWLGRAPRSLTPPDPRKWNGPHDDPSPALAGTLSPFEGERDRERAPMSIPRSTPIPVCGSGSLSLALALILALALPGALAQTVYEPGKSYFGRSNYIEVHRGGYALDHLRAAWRDLAAGGATGPQGGRVHFRR